MTSETSKREILLLLALFVGVAVAFLWVRTVQRSLFRAPDGHYVLADPDSFVRWRLVERALAGEGARIHWMTEDNAPDGRLNAWSSPMTILGATFVRIGERFGGMSRAQAFEWGGMWLGPIVGLVTLAALGLLGYRAGGWLLAGCWMVAWPVLIDVMIITGFGNTDHHSLHQLLFICVVGGCLAWARRPTRTGGIFVGLVCALAIWSAGSEVLPMWALVTGLALWELGWKTSDDALTRFWRGWWASGFLGTVAAWLFEFWPHSFHSRLEFISVWHVAVWAIIGTLLEVVRHRGIGKRWKLVAVAISMGVAVIAAAAMKGFDWQQLHIMQDARLKRLMSVTAECMSYPRDVPQAAQRGLIDFGLLPLLSIVVAFGFKKLDLRTRWVVVVTGCYLLLIFDQVRWLDFFVPLLVMTAGLAVTRLRGRDPVLCLVVMLLATSPPWILNLNIIRNMKSVGADPLRSPYVSTFALRAASDCLGATEQQPIVLAAWEQSSILAGMGKVSVVGSGYWPNLEGLDDTWQMLTTASEDRFWQLVQKRGVKFLLLPSPARLKEDVQLSFKALHGRLPTRPEISEAYVWQFLNNDQFPAVVCEEMTRLQPTWKIVRLTGPAKAAGGGWNG